MIRVFTFVVAMAGTGAYGEGAVSDAFGIVPSDGISPERAAWSGLSWVDGRQNLQTAGTPATIQLFAGPKSLEAGTDFGHAVALVFDQSGNLVDDGHRTVFQFKGRIELEDRTNNGIANVYFGREDVAGIYSVGASIQNLQSSRTTYRIVSRLEQTNLARLDAAQNKMRTEHIGRFSVPDISDDIGNMAEDGVFGEMLLAHGNGSLSWAGQTTLNSTLEFNILARNLPPHSIGYVSLGPKTTPSRQVDVVPLVATAKPRVQIRAIEDINAIELTIGPLATDAGFLLNDGADIAVQIIDNDGQSVTIDGWVVDGSFTSIVPLDPAHGPFEVVTTSVLGTFRDAPDIEVGR